MCTETFPAKTLAKLYDKVTGNNAEPPTADAKGWEMLSTSIGQADVFPLFSKIPLKRTPRISSPGTGDTDSHETSSAQWISQRLKSWVRGPNCSFYIQRFNRSLPSLLKIACMSTICKFSNPVVLFFLTGSDLCFDKHPVRVESERLDPPPCRSHHCR